MSDRTEPDRTASSSLRGLGLLSSLDAQQSLDGLQRDPLRGLNVHGGPVRPVDDDDPVQTRFCHLDCEPLRLDVDLLALLQLFLLGGLPLLEGGWSCAGGGVRGRVRCRGGVRGGVRGWCGAGVAAAVLGTGVQLLGRDRTLDWNWDWGLAWLDWVRVRDLDRGWDWILDLHGCSWGRSLSAGGGEKQVIKLSTPT